MKFIIVTLLFSFSAFASFTISLEGGNVWQSRNDAKIPPKNGDQLEFDEFNSGPFPHYRIEAFYEMTPKHSLRFLYAPFTIDVSGKSKKDIDFDGSTFSANTKIDVFYQFNSTRLTYIYSLSDKLKIGGTLKQRNAVIRFKQGSTKEEYDNIGYVPLFYYSYEHPLSNAWSFYSDGDLAGASQGRAVDITFKMRKALSNNFKYSIGIRSLDGGADNDKVYTYSTFHYAVVDLVMTL